MRKLAKCTMATFLFGFATIIVSAQVQPAASAVDTAEATIPVSTIDQAVDRIIAQEHKETVTISLYKPIIETYIQDMHVEKNMGAVPVNDSYFLGQADLSKRIVDRSIISRGGLMGHVSRAFEITNFNPAGFLQMVLIDGHGFDRQHYKFQYVGREFLGDVRCFVFDVTPLPKSSAGRFKGRIWAEDQTFAIVRFNGVYVPREMNSFLDFGNIGINIHFDSWRTNVQPGLWLPTCIFAEETHLKHAGIHDWFKSQTRLWGYDLKDTDLERQEDFSSLEIESAIPVQDQSLADTDHSPIAAEREWQREAEMNTMDALERAGLLSPPSDVDKVLDTVVNNIEVTNNLDEQFSAHCRVLLTSNLEAFTVGRTIVISRGLIDVLPDEGSLAAVLAQELADSLTLKQSIDEYGFSDTVRVPTRDVFQEFSFKDNPEEVKEASDKALQLLRNSPYRNNLAGAGLFLRQLNLESKYLKCLISARLGNGVYLASQLSTWGPSLQPDKLDQIAALPIGARVKLDPWTDQVQMLKAKPEVLVSAREKMPFEVTPFMPYLTRFRSQESKVNSANAAPTSNVSLEARQSQ